MRILIHGLNFFPEKIGIGKYTGELALKLDAEGHEVDVVTTPPYYPRWKIHEGFNGWGYTREKLNRIRVTRCPLWVPKKISGLKRILHLLTFGVSSIPAMFWRMFSRPDVIFVVEPSMFCLPTSWITAKLCGAKLWLHVQDFEVDAAFELGILKSRTARIFALSIESFLMKRFDIVSSISPKMVERLEQKGIAHERIRLFPNWVDCEKMFPIDGSEKLKKKFGLSETSTVALYAGNMGEKQGIEIIIDSARQISSRTNLQFVLCGCGAAYDRLKEYSKGLTNITWLPIQDDEQFNELMNAADIHLLPQRSDAADLVMPSKLTGMMATGRPVVAIASQGTQIQQVVDRHGIVVQPGDSQGFTAAIETLANDANLRKVLGDAARQYALDCLSADAIIGNFLTDLKSLLHEPQQSTMEHAS